MDSSEYAGQTVTIRLANNGTEHEYDVEDYWSNVTGGSWMFADGNPAALNYAMRVVDTLNTANPLPLDDNVLYGKIGAFGHLVHVSEIVE